MTGESDVISPTVQPTVQHRDTASDCIVGQERGFRCLPVVPGSVYCDNHSPERRERRREITRLAARASHVRRIAPELEVWADTIDLTTEDGRAQALTDVAKLVAKEAMTPAQGNAIAALARVAAVKAPPKAQPERLIVTEGGHEALEEPPA